MCSCVTVIKQTEHRARSKKDCNISDFIGDIEFQPGILSFSELRSLAVYQKNGRKINPGDVYIKQFNKSEDFVYTWIAKKDIFELLCKHDLFPCAC